MMNGSVVTDRWHWGDWDGAQKWFSLHDVEVAPRRHVIWAGICVMFARVPVSDSPTDNIKSQ